MWPLSDESRSLLSTFVDLATVPSILLNLWFVGAFLLRSYRPRSFLSGQWRGTLADLSGSLECSLIFYIERGQLTGQLYYEGQYEEERFVRGFDRLPNDSTRFKRDAGELSWKPLWLVRWVWRKLVGTRFKARFERVLHSIHREGSNTCVIERVPQPYEYEFRIHTRFRYPRIICEVASQPTTSGTIRCFAGELVKLKSA